MSEIPAAREPVGWDFLDEDVAGESATSAVSAPSARSAVSAASGTSAASAPSASSAASAASASSAPSASSAEDPEPTAPAGDIDLLNQVIQAMGGTRRSGQERMVELVCQALNRGEHLLVEAGTGTGKSLGYLVPALRWALEEEKRVIVATSTTALQRQIVGKDAPAVTQFCGQERDVAVLKGWSHYACMHKVTGGYPVEGPLFEMFSDGREASTSQIGEQVVRARKWAMQTQTGDRDDLKPGVSDEAWRQVSVTTDACLGQTCPMRDECFAVAAREAATDAALVVTNHAMLGVHCDGKTPVLGEFDALVVDEAHDLERAISNQATQHLHLSGIASRARRSQRVGMADASDLIEAGEALEKLLQDYPQGLITHRDDALVSHMRRLDLALGSYLRDLQANKEVDAAQRRVAAAALTDMEAFVDIWGREPEETITWLSRFEDGNATLHCGPLEVSHLIANHLLEKRPAVFTSATLKLGGSFQAVAHSLGLYLAGGGVVSEDVGTPFDLDKQGILYVARSLPPPTTSGISDPQLEELIKLAKASEGGVLGLFSSRAAATQAAQVLREELPWEVLAQGEGQLPQLVEAFAADPHSCLIGTMSLWQGIDVRGLACRLVVMDRVPFPVPTDPVVQARSRHVAKAGRNAFYEVSLNHAALRLSQGAGRLIRSHTDRGVVAILDSRVAKSRYSGYLLKTLPPFWRTDKLETAVGALARLAREIAH